MSFARKLRAVFATQIANMLVYRAEVIIWMLTGTLSFIMMAIWISQARSSPTGTIGGLTGGDFASYFLGTWIVGQLLVVWVVWELDMQVRLGQLSPKLLRPFDPMWEHVGAHIAEKVVRLPFMAVIVAAIVLLVPGAHVTADPLMWLAFAGVITVAFMTRFLLEYCLGMLAFWMESATSLQNLSFLAYAALGGIFAPLSLYPDAIRAFALVTPYPYMVNLPARMISGTASWSDVASGVVVLLGWLAALTTLRLVMWRRGVKRYGAVGA
ncbi:ABC transporter permease [Deinococcus yavapaiensis]|uniref:ABC-2 type transport system permease protein n=1 Tax=Deinococcus yavapaiensis KR-236 TaxID=694435 RepID=A0A318S8T5_9DEIO|nr:ABC-2 family transporter protein [Deinococcus yavapaiensis]PYE54945.1 ABC-2 type transport system permease protein [Deinococcus yavapaiensis KR-236]